MWRAIKSWRPRTLIAAGIAAVLGATAVAWAAQTNYLGTVFIADSTTPSQQLKVNADGSINATVVSGNGFPITLGSTSIAAGSTTNSVTGLSIVAGGGNTFGATSLALDGCTLGTDKFCVATADTATIAGTTFSNTQVIGGASIYAAAATSLGWFSRGFMTSSGTNNISIGGFATATPIAYTVGLSADGSGTNIAGVNSTLRGSRGTGNANSGDVIIQTGGAVAGSGTTLATATNRIVIKGVTGNIQLPSITSDTGLTDASVCEDTTNHAMFSGSGTLGICLGTSSARYKTGIASLIPGLPEILRLQPKSFYLAKAHGDPKKQMYGFIAEDMVKVLPKLVGLDKQGRPNSADYLGVVPILVKAVQQQQAQIATLRAANDNLQVRLARLEGAPGARKRK